MVARSISDSLEQPPTGRSVSSSEINAAVRCAQAWAIAGQLSPEALSELYPLLLAHLATNEETTPLVCGCLEDWLLNCSSFFTATRADSLLNFFASEFVAGVFASAAESESASVLRMTVY